MLVPAALTSAVCELFDHVQDLQFWIKDRRGRYIRVNRGLLLNYSLEHSEQVLGKTDYDLSPTHLADQYRLDDARVLKGESILGRIELVGRYDHTAVWSVTHKLPVKSARGKITGTAGITRPLDKSNASMDAQDQAMSRVASMIRGDFARPWSNRELAKAAAMSERAFERRFRGLFRVSPQVYIRQLKARMATHALVYSSQPLAEIAADFGYADQSHFTREFRRFTAMTPRAYRQRFRSV